MTHATNVDEGTEPYRTLHTEGRAEWVVERSRFLALARPIRTDDDAEAAIEALHKEHFDARHVCSAFAVGRGTAGLRRWNDDGEPGRTAGFPLLQLLEGAELTDTFLGVVRYYGGVKLGTGGLSRAYREAGRLALDDATIQTRWPESTTQLTLPYARLDALLHLLSSMEDVRVVDTAYTDAPTLTLRVRKAGLHALRQRLGGFLQCDPETLLPVDAVSGSEDPHTP